MSALLYRRSDEVYWRNTAHGVLILTESGEPFSARGATVDLWHQLTEPSSEPELCTRLALKFRQPLDEVAPLIRRVLDDLRSIGAVTAA
jgi:hypothetical protein